MRVSRVRIGESKNLTAFEITLDKDFPCFVRVGRELGSRDTMKEYLLGTKKVGTP